ncbi:hypothetical protein MLD38_040801 [Melastoma candidum]|nr:hypothetical protein MLD38_040801 [Melastoma candidum]
MEKVAMKKPKLQPPSLGIFWDTISCPIPDGVNPGDVLDNIIAALRVHFPDHDLGAFFVYGVDSKTRPLRPREGDGAKLRVVDGAYSLYQQIHRDAALVLPLSDPAARGYCEFPDFLLLDWLWVSRGSGKIITMDDFGSVAAAAPVAGDAVIPEVFYYAQKAVLHPTGPLFEQDTQTLKPRCVRALKRIFILCHHDTDGALSDEEVKCFGSPVLPSEIVGVKRRRKKGRLETTFTALRKFGYDNDIKLPANLIPVPVKKSPDQIITRDDFGSVAATAPVAGDAEAVEGHCGSGLHIQTRSSHFLLDRGGLVDRSPDRGRRISRDREVELKCTAATEVFPENVPPVLLPTRLPRCTYPDRVPSTVIATSSRVEGSGKLGEELR